MHIFFVNGIGVVFHTECKICICKLQVLNVIIIFVEEFQPLTKMWERNRILHLYNIAMTLLAHIINVESWSRCCSGWCKICGIMLILMGVVGKIVSWMLSFGHDVDFDEGGGWTNCKEYHICPWGREVPLLALCTPWLLATHVCAYHGYLLLTLVHTLVTCYLLLCILTEDNDH